MALRLSSATNATLDGGGATLDATGTIEDNDTATLAIADATAAEGATATFAVTLSTESAADVTVTATTSTGGGDTATAGADYTHKAQELTIAAGDTEAEFDVAILSDTLDELDETFTVTLSGATGATIADPTATGTITGNAATLIRIADAAAREGDPLSFTLTRSGSTAAASTVSWTTGDDTAAGASKATATGDEADYTPVATARTVTFAIGDTAEAITVATAADLLVEGDETFRVTLAGATGATLANTHATGTITEGTTGYAIGDASAAEGDTLTFTVTRSGNTAAASTVDWTTGDDTARGASRATASGDGADYTARTAAQALGFRAGETAATLAVASIEDGLDEPDETFTVTLADPSPAGALLAATATGTITDDDDATATVSVADADAVDEGDDPAATTDMTFAVTLSAASGQTVTVPYTLAGDATAGADYTEPDPLSVDIEPGDTAADIVIPVRGDTVDEPGETVTVTLGQPTHATLSTAEGATTADGTITDDDATPTLALALDPASIDESGAGNESTVTATLSGASSQAVTLTVAAAPVSPAVADDFTLAGATLTIAAGRTASTGTVTVTAVDNDVDAPDKTVTVSATAAGGNGVAAPDAVTLSIEDDDERGVTVSAAADGVTVAEADSAATMDAREDQATYTVVLDSQPTGTVTIAVRSGDTDVATAAPAALTFTAGNWSTAKTVTVTAVADDADNPGDRRTVDIAHTVSASGTDYATETADPVTVTVTDDDAAPGGVTLTVDTNGAADGTPDTVAEGAGATAVTVTATVNGSTRYGEAKTVTVSVSDGTAASPADYAAVADFDITIPANAASHTGAFTLTPADDAIDEPGETVSVAGALSGVTVTPDTLTITDNDATPTLALALDPASIDESGDDNESTVTATLSGASSQAVTLTVAATPVSPAVAADFTLAGATLTIAAGSLASTGTVTVTAADNDVDALDKTVRVSATAAGGNGVAAPAAVTLTIEDDDERGVTVTPGTLTLDEADDPQTQDATENVDTYTVALDSEPTGTVTIAVRSADATVATALPATLTFTASDWAAKTVTVTAVADDADNPGDRRTVDIAHTVSASGTDYALVTADPVTVTVTDDDATPGGVTLTVDTNGAADGTPDTVAEGAGATAVTVTATVNGSTRYGEAKTVTVSVADGTAASPADYAAVADFDIVIPANAAGHAGTFTITPVDDAIDEPGETVSVAGALSGVTVTPDTLTITDNDATPTVTLALDPASIDESGAGNESTVTATLSGASSQAVTLTVSATPVSPAVAADFTLAGATLTIAAGRTASTGTVTVTAADNDVDADDKTVTVSATAAGGNGVAAPGAVTLTIEDDDERGVTVSAAEDGVTVAEADSAATMDAREDQATYTVALDSEPTGTVTVNLESGDTDVATVAPAALTFTASDWAAKTVTVTAVDDDLDNANGRRATRITHTVSAATTDYAAVTADPVAVTVTDDEAAPTLALVLTPASIDESGAGNESTVTATLSGASSQAVTLTVAATPVSPAVAADFTLAGATLTIAAGRTASTGTVTVTAVDNDVDAANRTVTVSATAAGGNGVAAPDAVTLTIEDDDERGVTVTPGTLTLDEVDDTQTAGATENQDTYTVALDSQPTGTVTVNIESEDTDIATVAPARLTFTTGNWSTAQGVTVTAVADDADNPGDRRTADIAHTVSASGTDYALVTAAPVTVTVTDDDAAPGGVTLTVDTNGAAAGTPDTVAEGAGATAVTVTATVNGSTRYGEAKTVTVSVSDGTAASPADYAAVADFDIVIPLGAASHTGSFTLTPADDAVDEPGETVTVTGALSGVTVTPDTVTITDNDATPTLALVLDPASIDESGAGNESTVTATLSGASSQAVTLTVSATPVSPAVAADFTLAGATLTIAAGALASTGAVTVTAADNDVDAEDRTVTVSATAAGGNGVADPADRTLTIADDDDPAVSFGSSAYGVDEGDMVTLTLEVVRPQATATAVGIACAAGTTGAAEFSGCPASVTVPADAGTHTFTVQTTEDMADEPAETFTVTISSVPGGLAIGTPSTATVTVADDDDPAVNLSVSGGGAASEGGSALTITATRGEANTSGGALTIPIQVKASDTTAQPSDYTVASSISIPNNASSGTTTFAAVDDSVDEPAETVVIELGTLPSGSMAGPNDEVTITIADDDTRGVTVTPGALTVDEADDTQTAGATENQDTYTVALDSQPTGTVTVNIESEDTDIATVAPARLTFTTGNWSTAQGVTVTAVADDADNPGDRRTADIAHTVSASGTDYALVTAAPVTVTVTDDDAAPGGVTLTVDTNGAAAGTPDTVAEGAGATAVTVTATVNGSTRYGEAKTVTVSVADGTAASPADYAAVADFDIVIPANAASHAGTFTITPADDAIDEPGETVSITGALSGVTVTPDTVTITDNDATPTLALALDPASIDESGAANRSTVTATLSGASSQAVTLTVAAAADDPAVAADFTQTGTTLTIAAGALTSTGTVTVTAVDNDVDAANKTVTVSATATGGNGVAAPAAVTLTIADDDERGVTVSAAEDGVTVDEADDPATTGNREDQATYTVALDSQPTGTVTIAVRSEDATVATAAPATLTFTPSDWAAKTVTITAVDDDLDNANGRRATRITHTVSAATTDYAAVTADPVAVTVTDDEAAPTLALVLDPASIDESGAGNESTVTATLSGASSQAVTLTVAATPVSPAVAADFTLAGATLTIAAGSLASTGAVTVTAVDNDVDAADKAVTVSATAAGGNGVADPASRTLTLNDDDDPAVSFGSAAYGVDEGDMVTLTLEVVRPQATTTAVGIACAAGTTGAAEFSGCPASVTVPADAGTHTFTVQTTEDMADEPAETFTVTISSVPDGLAIGTPSTATVTVADDDDPAVNLSVSGGGAASEGGSALTITATRGEANTSGGALTIPIQVKASGTTAQPSDYTVASSISIPNNASSGTTTFAAVDDSVDEPAETVVIELGTLPSGSMAGPNDEVTITIADDDTRGVTVTPGALTLDEADDPQTQDATENVDTYTVALDSEPTGTVSIAVRSGDTDVATAAPAALTFTPSDWAAKTVTVTAVADDADNPGDRRTADITHTVSASGTDYASETADPVTVTVADDDAAPGGVTLTVDTNGAADGTPDTVAEGAGATAVTVTATVNGSTRYGEAKTVTVSVADGTAASPADYAAVADFDIVIPANAAGHAGTFTITPADDAIDEPGETVSITGALSGVTVTPDTVTITDNDERGVTVMPGTLTVDEADDPGTSGTTENQATYTIALDSQPTGTVTIAVGSEDTDVATAAPASLTFTPSDWAAKTVTVTAVADDADNPGDRRTVDIAHTVSASGTDYASETASPVTVTVTDDDGTPTATLTLTPASIDESGSSNASTVTASLSGPASQAVTLTVSAAAVAPAANSAFSLSTNKTLTIAKDATASTGQVTITAVDNSVDADDAKVTVSASASGGGVANPANATLTIVDDDEATLSIANASAAEGGTANFTVSLSTPSATNVTVTATTSPGTATAPADYTHKSQALTIAAGSTSVTFAVAIATDSINELDETFTVTLSQASVNITTATATGTITGSGALISISDASAVEGSALSFALTRTGDTSGAASVNWTTGNDTAQGASRATAGSDYTAVTSAQTVSFAANASTATLNVTSLADSLIEGSETFRVNLANPTGASLANSFATGTITEGTTGYAIADASADEGDAITFVITRAGLTTGASSVKWSTAPDAGGSSPAAASDYTPVTTAQTVSFAAGLTSKTLSVNTTDDAMPEADETFLVVLSAPSGAGVLTRSTATGTIRNDDTTAPTATLTLTPASIDERGADNESLVTASLSGPWAQNVTLTVAASGASGAFTMSNNRTLTIAAGETASTGVVEITAVDNDIDAANVQVTVSAAASGGVGNPANVILTIEDDDARGVSVTPTSLTLEEADDAGTSDVSEHKGTYEVVLTSRPTGTVTVNIASSDTSVATVSPQSLTFAPAVWDDRQIVTVTAVPDNYDNAGDQRSASISNIVSASGTDYAGQAAPPVAVAVSDDDEPPVIALSTSSNRVREDAGSTRMTLTATLMGSTRMVSEQMVQITVGKAGDSATKGTDYMEVRSLEVPIAKDARSGSASFMMTPIDDTMDEEDESVTISGEVAGFSVSDTQLTIVDDDATPIARLTVSPDRIDESGLRDGWLNQSRVRASLSGASSRDVFLTVSASALSPATNSAFTFGQNRTLTIAAGSTRSTGDVRIHAVDNWIDAPDAKVRVFARAGGGGVADPAGVTLTIVDDDEAKLSISDASAPEGGTARFTIRLSTLTAEDVTLTATTSPGTATAPADYTHKSETLSIRAGTRSTTFSVPIATDSINELDETFTVTLSDASVAIADATATGTIEGVDALFSISEASAVEGDELAFTITRRGDTSARASLTWTTGEDSTQGARTATPNDDYAAVTRARTVRFRAGATTATVEVKTYADRLIEGSETLRVNLADARGAFLGDTYAVGTIAEGTTGHRISDASGDEGEAIRFTITREGRVSEPSSVKWSTALDTDGSHPAYAFDFTAVSSAETVRFKAGETTKTIEVASLEDGIDEPDETFVVRLSAPTGGILLGADAIGTIKDDDATPTATLALTPASIGEDGESLVTASLSHPSSERVTLTVAASGAEGAFTMSENRTLTIAAGATDSLGVVEIRAVDNEIDAPDAEVSVSAAASGGGVADPTDVALMIEDDDTRGVRIAPTRLTLSEEDDARTGDEIESSGTYELALSSEPTGTVTINLASGDAKTARLSAERLTFAPADWNKAQVVTVTAVPDSYDNAGDERTVSIANTVSAAGTDYAGETAAAVEVTVIDDDDAPVIALSASPERVAEDGGGVSVTVTATLTSATRLATDQKIRVEVGAAGDSAVAGSEYIEVESFDIPLSRDAPSGSASFTMTPIDDAVDAQNVSLTISGELAGASVMGTELTIVDDDATPVATLMLDPARINEGGSGSMSLVRASLSGASSREVTLTVASAGTSGAFTVSDNKILTISAGETESTGDVHISAVDNWIDAPDAKVRVSATASGGGVANPEGATLTIVDDDEATLSIADASAIEGGTARFRIRLSTPSAEDVTLTATTSAGTATAPADYTHKSEALLIAAGDNSAVFDVEIAEDMVPELDETFAVTLSKASVAVTDATAAGTIEGARALFSISDASAVEGAELGFTVTRIGDASGVASVAFTTEDDSAGAADYSAVSTPQTVSFKAGERTTTIRIATADDNVDEPDERFVVRLSAPTGGEISSASAVGRILDNDATPTASLELAPASIDESGENSSSLVTASLSHPSSMEVILTVDASGASGAFTMSDSKTLTIVPGDTESTGWVAISAVDDEIDGFDVLVTVSGTANGGDVTRSGGAGGTEANAPPDADQSAGGVANPASVYLTITDDDIASLSVSDASAVEGDVARFAVTLSIESARDVTVTATTVDGTATAPADYSFRSEALTIPAGDMSTDFEVAIIADSVSELEETFSVTLDKASVPITRDTATGRIEKNVDPIPGGWLARFGRALTQQSIDAVTARVQASREPGFKGEVPSLGIGGNGRWQDDQDSASAREGSGEAPMSSSGPMAMSAQPLSMQAPSFMSGPAVSGPAGTASMHGRGSARVGHASGQVAGQVPGQGSMVDGTAGGSRGGAEQSISDLLYQAFAGASFVNTREADEAGGTLAYWGQGAHSQFSGAEDHLRLSGKLTTGRVGVDYARDNWLAGVALAHSVGSGDWSGGVGDGELRASMASLTPYAAMSFSERFKVWSTLGAGWGDLTVKHGSNQDIAEELETGLQWRMAAAGIESALLGSPEGSDLGLSLVADAMWSDTLSQEGDGLAATQGAVTRLRVGLEGHWNLELDGGGSITPKIEIGARQDAGDAETGFGVDVGGGLAWQAPDLGISLDLKGRTLVSHDDEDFEDWGVSATFAYRADPASEEGLAFKIGQELGGQTSGGVAAMFTPDPRETRFGASGASRWTSELSYGLPLFGDTFLVVPQLQLGESEQGRDYGLGWRLTSTEEGLKLSLDLLSTLRESAEADPEIGIQVEFKASW